MTMQVWIEPNERYEAIEAYRSWLTEEQITTIRDAPDEAVIKIIRKLDGTTEVAVIEE